MRKGNTFLGIFCLILVVVMIGCFIAAGIMLKNDPNNRGLFGFIGDAVRGITVRIGGEAEIIGESIAQSADRFAQSVAEGSRTFGSSLGDFLEEIGDVVLDGTDSLWNAQDITGLTDVSFTRSVPAADVDSVSVEMVTGGVEVLPATDGNVTVEYTAFLDPSLVSRHSCKLLQKDGDLTLRQSFGSNVSWSGSLRNRVYTKVYLPQDLLVDFEAEMVNGPLVVSAVQLDEVELNCVNGGAVFTETGCRELEFEMVNGTFTGQFVGEAPRISGNTVNGGVRILLPAGAQFHFDLETVNGSLQVEDGFDQGTTFSKQKKFEMTGKVGSGRDIHVETVNGSITIAVK